MYVHGIGIAKTPPEGICLSSFSTPTCSLNQRSKKRFGELCRDERAYLEDPRGAHEAGDGRGYRGGEAAPVDEVAGVGDDRHGLLVPGGTEPEVSNGGVSLYLSRSYLFQLSWAGGFQFFGVLLQRFKPLELEMSKIKVYIIVSLFWRKP